MLDVKFLLGLLLSCPNERLWFGCAPDVVRRYPLGTCYVLIYLMRACDMNTSCKLGPSECTEAAVGRLQV